MRFKVLNGFPGELAVKEQPVEMWLEQEGEHVVMLKARNSETPHVNVLSLSSNGIWLCTGVSEQLGLPLDHLWRVKVIP